MSEIPAYVSLERLRRELGDMSDRTFLRWRKQPGFPMPKRFGLYEWKEVKAFMDGRQKRDVSSRLPVNELEEMRRAHEEFKASRRSH